MVLRYGPYKLLDPVEARSLRRWPVARVGNERPETVWQPEIKFGWQVVPAY